MPKTNPIRRHVHKELSRHGKLRYYFRINDGPRIRLPDNPDSPEFRSAYSHLIAGREVPSPIPRVIVGRDVILPLPVRKVPLDEACRPLVIKTVRNSTRKARERARRKGVPYNLTPEWAEEQVKAQGFRCALSGVPFYMEKERRTKHHPYMPSLDRIEPRLGYVIGNVRILTFAMNMMLSDWGEEVFFRTAQGYRSNRGSEAMKLDPLPATAVRFRGERA